MSLPAALQPAWPLFKRAHRLLAHVLGILFRMVSPALGRRGVPRRATTSSRVTAELAPSVARIHPAGPAEYLVRSAPQGSPPRHPVFTRACAVTVPARYVLELDRGVAVGEFGAHVTQDGVLDYETSGYFGLSGWQEHPIYLRPTLPRTKHVPGTVASLTSRGAASNYYHFMFDVLPRIGILRETLPQRRIDAAIVPHRTRYQRQLLELIGLDVPLIEPGPHSAWQADTLLVPSTPNQDLAAPRWGTAWLRANLPPTAAVDAERIYLTRGSKPNTRRYVHEAELVPALERRGFVVVDPGTLSVQEQINLFASARTVVAPHGAGLTNIAFARPGTQVLELFAGNYVHLGLWSIAESVGDLDYRYLVAEGRHRADASMTGVLSDVDIPPRAVLDAVDNLLAGS